MNIWESAGKKVPRCWDEGLQVGPVLQQFQLPLFRKAPLKKGLQGSLGFCPKSETQHSKRKPLSDFLHENQMQTNQKLRRLGPNLKIKINENIIRQFVWVLRIYCACMYIIVVDFAVYLLLHLQVIFEVVTLIQTLVQFWCRKLESSHWKPNREVLRRSVVPLDKKKAAWLERP